MSDQIFTAIDLGASATKVAYSASGKISYMVGTPTVHFLNERSVLSHLEAQPSSFQELSLDYSYVVSNNECATIGRLADEILADEAKVPPIKYERGIWKILAAIGAITNKVGIQDLEMQLVVTLPYREYLEKDRLSESLLEKIADFRFCDLPISVNLSRVKFLPEGYGHILRHRRRTDDQHVTAIMLGYRDASVLTHIPGQAPVGSTQSYGALSITELVGRHYPQMQLAGAISQAMQGKKILSEPFEKILFAERPRERQHECDRIKRSVKDAKDRLWDQIHPWLLKQIPADVRSPVLAGGSVAIWRPELIALQKSDLKGRYFSWYADSLEDVQVTLGTTEQPLEESWAIRFADVFYLLLEMLNQGAKP